MASDVVLCVVGEVGFMLANPMVKSLQKHGPCSCSNSSIPYLLSLPAWGGTPAATAVILIPSSSAALPYTEACFLNVWSKQIPTLTLQLLNCSSAITFQQAFAELLKG
ncbi:unnamed protein product [Arctogadus glacialis]